MFFEMETKSCGGMYVDHVYQYCVYPEKIQSLKLLGSDLSDIRDLSAPKI